MFQCLTSIYSSLAETPQITSWIAMCAVCKHTDWKMFFPTADVQCDFGSYLLPREGIRGGSMMRQNGKEKRLTRERQAVAKETEKGGNHPVEATDSKRTERGRVMEMNGERQLGGAGGDQWECEEKWQRHSVIQRKLGCRRKLKEQWQRVELLPSHGLWSLNIYINNVRDMRKPPGNKIQGCAAGRASLDAREIQGKWNTGPMRPCRGDETG